MAKEKSKRLSELLHLHRISPLELTDKQWKECLASSEKQVREFCRGFVRNVGSTEERAELLARTPQVSAHDRMLIACYTKPALHKIDVQHDDIIYLRKENRCLRREKRVLKAEAIRWRDRCSQEKNCRLTIRSAYDSIKHENEELRKNKDKK